MRASGGWRASSHLRPIRGLMGIRRVSGDPAMMEMTTRPSLTREPPRVLALPISGLSEALVGAGFAVVPWPQGSEAGVVALAPEVDAVITIGGRALPQGFLAAATRLSVICCFGTGYENYDPALLAARGVRLANGGGSNAEDVADLGLGLFLAARRRIVEADGWVKGGRWPTVRPMARRVRGSRMGILGLGGIGRALAVRGEALGMTVGWSGPRPKEVGWPRFATALELARWCDALFVCARPTADNDGVVDTEVLDALGPEGVLVNVARGSLVDEEALIRALREGRLGAAALDVFAEEPTDPAKWAGTPNLTLHPHSGAATLEAMADGCARAVENLRRHFAGDELLTPVN
jgi:lactate dehydrogenase-like 2-hydroxyacid dehydrogenase